MTIKFDVSGKDTITLDEVMAMARDKLTTPQNPLTLIHTNSEILATFSVGMTTHFASAMSLLEGEWDQDLFDQVTQGIELAAKDHLKGMKVCKTSAH